MTCPKCHGEMRMYERSGVTVDQCTECRGIFLDRGELERLFEAESAWNTRNARPAPQPGAYAPPPPGGYAPQAAPYGPGDGPERYAHHGHYRHHGHYCDRRPKSFLHELFD